jgi:quercetin dioxygenase-like cupin family protein
VLTITAAQIARADNPHGVDIRHLYATQLVAASEFTLAPGESVKPHKAPVDVFFYVLAGTPMFEIEGETAETAPGTLVPSKAGHVHCVRNESGAPVRFLVVRTPNPNA